MQPIASWPVRTSGNLATSHHLPGANLIAVFRPLPCHLEAARQREAASVGRLRWLRSGRQTPRLLPQLRQLLTGVLACSAHAVHSASQTDAVITDIISETASG